MKKPKRISRKVIYENRWINLYLDKVEFPAGRVIEDYHALEFDREAVGVIVENENNDLLMVESYRYVTNSIAWEIPAGGIDEGESVVEAGKREVLEETGYNTIEHKELYSYYPSIGNSNQVFNIIRCKAEGVSSGVFDRNEVRDVSWFSRGEVKELLSKGLIKDGYTLSALLMLREF